MFDLKPRKSVFRNVGIFLEKQKVGLFVLKVYTFKSYLIIINF